MRRRPAKVGDRQLTDRFTDGLDEHHRTTDDQGDDTDGYGDDECGPPDP